MTRSFHACLAIATALVCLAPQQAPAGLITSSPILPPAGGVYAPGAGTKALFDFVSTFGYFIQLTDTVHTVGLAPPKCYVPPAPPIDCKSPLDLAEGESQIESFFSDARFTLTLLDPAGVIMVPPMAMAFSGIEVRTKITRTDDPMIPDDTTYFDTELLLLTIVGEIDRAVFTLQLDETRPSKGETTITGLGGSALTGPFRIESFFDVFTELSIDGSPFVKSAFGGRQILVPEPAGLLLSVTALGLLGLVRLLFGGLCGPTRRTA